METIPDEDKGQPRQDLPGTAEVVFADFLGELDAGGGRSFDELCRQHPELREELRLLHDQWRFLSPLQRDLTPGEGARIETGQVLGDFCLVRLLGSGGMGEVWEAEQITLGRSVALKLLRPGLAVSERELTRFRREAVAGGRLSHPSIVTVHGIGEWRGQHFIVQELVQSGRSLRQLLADVHARPQPPKDYYRWVARFFRQVAEALHAAHEQGVVHRDIKPANILVGSDLQPKITDFGLATIVDVGPLSVTGEFSGTLLYMSPEQAMAKRIGIDHRTDVFSLGATLYEALTLTRPFEGDTPLQVTEKIVLHDPPDPRRLRSQVPQELSVISMKALEKRRGRRYASMQDMAADLQRYLRREPIHARPVGPHLRALKWVLRHRLAAGFLATGVAALVVISSLLVENVRSRRDAERTLRNSLLTEARALRQSGKMGQRNVALQKLVRAAALRPGADLRNEAVASLARTDVRTLRRSARNRGLRELVFDDQLARYAAAHSDGRISVRPLTGGADPVELPGSGAAAWAAQFSPDGRYLAAAYNNAETSFFRLWEIATRRAIVSLDELVVHRSMDFSPDGSRLAVGVGKGEVHLYDLPSGKRTGGFRFGRPMSAIRFRPDGRALAAALLDVPITEVRRCTDGGLLRRFEEASASINTVAWSRDGSLLAMAHGQVVHLVDLEKAEKRRTLSGHQATVTEVWFSSDDRLVATRSWDATTRLWEVATGLELVSIGGRALGMARDRPHLAFATDKEIGIWTIQHGEVLRSMRGPAGSPRTLAIAPAGGMLASAGRHGLRLWDLRTGRLIGSEAGQFDSVHFLPDGGLLASGVDGVTQWTLRTEGNPFQDASRKRIARKRCGPLSASTDGRLVGVVLPAVPVTGHVGLIDRVERKRSKILQGRPGLSRIALSPDGEWIAASSWMEGGVQVWNVRSGELVEELLPESLSVALAFSPDSEWLVTGQAFEYRAFKVGTWEAGARIHRPTPYRRAPPPAAFNRGGTLMAIALTASRIRLIDTRSWSRVFDLETPHNYYLGAVAFGAGGKRLFFATHASIWVWDLARIGRELRAAGLDYDLPAAWPQAK